MYLDSFAHSQATLLTRFHGRGNPRPRASANGCANFGDGGAAYPVSIVARDSRDAFSLFRSLRTSLVLPTEAAHENEMMPPVITG
jgi:hypothetical protein